MFSSFRLMGAILMRLQIFDFPLLIQIAAIVIVLAALMIIATVVTIFYKRDQIKAYQKEADEVEEIILEELNDHLLKYDSLAEMPKQEMDDTITQLNQIKDRGKIPKEVLAKLLIYFKHNLTGSIARLINAAYARLNLRELTLTKLKSKLWFTRANGLKELQDITDSVPIKSIHPLLADENQDVRVEAYAALIKLNDNSAFDFLEKEKEELSNWHQILLFDAVTKAEDLKIPDVASYFNKTENKSILLFAIKLILHYKQFNAVPALIELLSHQDEEVRNQSICALGALDANEAETKLISLYPNEHNKNKAQILLAIGDIASGNSIEFIKEKLLKADHYTILKSAVAAVMAHPAIFKNKILDGLTNLDEEQRAVIKHFEDPLIRLNGAS